MAALESLLKLRKVVRAAFTRTVTSLKTEINNEGGFDKKKLQATLCLLEKKNEELLELNGKVMIAKMDVVHEDVDEEAQLNELDEDSKTCDGYHSQFLELNLEVLGLINNESPGDYDEDARSLSHSDNAGSRRKFRLPKLELRTFDGNIKDWLQFWCLFEKIHQDPDIVPADKFQYLIQATVKNSRAREIVESFPPTGSNYQKAVDSLKSRFGRDDLLVEVYVRELLKLVLKNATSKGSSSLSSLYDSLESQIRALETLGVTTEKCAAMLFPLVESCMPEEFLRAWQRSVSCVHGNEPKTRLEELMKFLKSEVESEERINLALAGFGLKDESKSKKKQNNVKEDPVPTAAGLLTTTSEKTENKQNCVFCKGQHESSSCFNAQKMNLDDKQKILKESGCCFKCFRRGHCVKSCKSFARCIVCGKGHAVLMCPDVPINQNKKATKTRTEGMKEGKSVDLANLSASPSVLLQTLIVKLEGPHKTIQVRALIDSGSQKSYVLNSTAARMNLIPQRQQVITHSLFGGVKTAQQKHDCYKLELSSLDAKYRCNFEVLGQAMICDTVPSVQKGPWMDELRTRKILVADVAENPGPIEVLIGADVAGKILTGNQKVLSCGLVAFETHLGWTVMGKVPSGDLEDSVAMMVTSMFITDASITDLWQLDVLGITDPAIAKTNEERELQTKIQFRESITVNEDGRYEVSLPWSDESFPLPDNKNIAMKRLQSTSKKLNSESLFLPYDDVFKQWSTLGVIEKVSADQEIIGTEHYLPHRPVVKKSSNTTKIRPVFDASARERASPSLNQCLESGPNLIKLIPSVLLKFRELKYGVVADIEKAFLQISVRPDDRDVLRFFWWASKVDKHMSIYRHARVVFGLKCSPFLLGAVIEFHLQKHFENPNYHQKLMKKLLNSFYVDNVVTSLNSESELKQFITEAQDVMAKGKFNLREWQYIGDGDPENNIVPVLGLLWDRKKDILVVKMDWLEDSLPEKITKRTILSVAHKLFDPIGLTIPVSLIPKLLLQRMWKSGVAWDMEVDGAIREEFLRWYEDLHLLKEACICRWIHLSPGNNEEVSLHTFCDASCLAYAAVVFVRIKSSTGVQVHLLAAKSRVAPVKSLTIPRLELMAATVGARLVNSVLDGLQWKNAKLYFWTDSTTVLSWIRREEVWAVFVNNRVQEIKKLTDTENWNHIPGEKNPADLPSRGCSVKQLLAARWWEGPDWLRGEPVSWPSSETVSVDEETVLKEKRKTSSKMGENSCLLSKIVVCEWCDSPKDEKNNLCKYHGMKWYFRYFSNYNKMVRMLAWIRRFIHNCQKKNSRLVGDLNFDEFHNAEKEIIKFVQTESFEECGPKLSNLKVFKDEQGILRLKTKIVYRKDTEDFRNPIVLPSEHPVTHRLIVAEHKINSHAGTQMLLNILREHYWILDAKRTIRKVISRCTRCIRHGKNNLTPPAAPLPENRIKDGAVFEIVGVDLAGPLHLVDGTKAWFCLYTCAIYRAVHLELLSSLSTEVFLQGFRRFIARRGRPTIVYCDNGSNFVGASNCLKLIDWDEIGQYSTARKIKWLFNPPSASWWGGFWERLIGPIKMIIKKVLGNAHLTYEEMTTILCDAEAILNSRPLTYVSEQGDDELVPLSPALFLQDVKQIGVPDFDAVDQKTLNRRLKYRHKIVMDLRRRFRSEYLGVLIQKPDAKKYRQQISIGDVVLIGSDNLKRLDWPLGRVIEVLPGQENVTRLVRLQTASGRFLRPVQRIYPLEVSSEWVDNVGKVPIIAREKPTPESAVSLKQDEPQPKYYTRAGREVKVRKVLDW